MIKINKLLLIIEIAFAYEYNIFHRLVLVSSLLIIPIIKLFNENKDQSNKTLSNLKLAAVLIIMIACARGNLCGYKFFLLSS